MPYLSLPEGAYFSVIGNVRLGAGGQTRLALLRHRLFTLHAGVELPILTYNPVASYDAVRSQLLAESQLLPQSRLLNMHEELRTAPLDHLPATGALPDLGDRVSEDDVEDGVAWRRRYAAVDAGEVWDYLRTDGSVYARTPALDEPGGVFLCNGAGDVVDQWSGLGGLWRWWTKAVVPAEGRVFLLSDSRFIAEELSLLGDDRHFVLHQMHNPHLTGARRWNSPVSETYRSSMDTLGRLDALISLSERQRDDIAKRYGATTNLFVVPNPVESVPLPEPPPGRRPRAITMIARLDGQKRVDRAVEAFGKVLAALPDATLDIYGDGELRQVLQQQIDAAGLAGSITLHGHDPHAREALWESSLFWLTSQFEGYPLSTLEAMSHGCPVISMDMKYGPREQIDDGVDGFLIGPGDTDALAARTVALLQEPARLEPMRAAARAKAAAHGHDRFLADWQAVLKRVVALAPTRVAWRVRESNLDIRGVSGGRHPLVVRGWVDIETTQAERLDEAVLQLQVYSPDHDDLVSLPSIVERDGSRLTVTSTVDRPTLEATIPGARRLIFRISLVWQNLAFHDEVSPEDTHRRSPRSVLGAALRRGGLRR